jgi:predicted PurR-regulated permease PerM
VSEPQRPTAIFDSRTLRVLWTTLAVVATVGVVVVARKTFVILIFALLFSYLMEPMVSRVQRWMKGKRVRAVAVTYLAFWILIGALLFVIGNTLAEQGKSFISKAPQTAQKLQSGEMAKDFGQKHGLSAQTADKTQRWFQSHQEKIQAVLGYFVRVAQKYAVNLVAVLLVPLLAMLFPQDRTRFPIELVETYARGNNRAFLTAVIQDCDEMLLAYMWAQFLLSVFAFIAFIIALNLLHVPYAVLFTVIASILEFIPIVGPLIAAILILGTTVITGGNWIGVLIFLGAWRLVQDYVNTPLLFNKQLEMHPLAVLGAVMIGGEVFGGLGMFVAIPAAAASRIIWWRYRQIQAQALDHARLETAPPESRAA